MPLGTDSEYDPLAAGSPPPAAPAAPTPYTGPGPNDDAGGQGYDPAVHGGTFADWQANRRAYRSTFNPNDPNGWRGRRNEAEDMQMAAEIRNNPAILRNQGLWDAMLARLGIFNQKDMRQSRYKSLGMARDGGLIYNTNFHLDGNGNYMDVATSDQANKYRPKPLSGNPNLAGQANNPFVDQLDAPSANLFQRWQRQGVTGMPMDPATGYYIQQGPGGTFYYDSRGYRVDPRTGQILGHYTMQGGNLGSLYS